jgi:hypothetical protein
LGDGVEARDQRPVAGGNLLKQTESAEQGPAEIMGGLFEVIDPFVGVAEEIALVLGEVGVRAFDGTDLPVE